MLRQVYIFHNQQEIFRHSLALALGREELKNVMEIIEPYMILPTPGQTLHRPISKFQIFHRSYGNTYFLIVVDLTDSFDYVNEILMKIINNFKDLFSNPEDIKGPSSEKSEFIKTIYSAQKDLHSKITIIGPTNSGKTTLYNLLKSGQERKIKDFANAAIYEIDNLIFDIWDFLLKENFSPMLNKFLGGSDLVILIIDSQDYGPKLIEYFISLIENNARYSKLLLMANKSDLVSKEELEQIKSTINIPNIEDISLIDHTSAKEKLQLLIRKVLKFKRDLPSNFEILMNEAGKLSKENNFSAAIAKYKELIDVCNECQNFTYLDTLQNKLDELNKQREKQIEQRNKVEIRGGFAPPEQIKFTQKVSVKSLPKTSSALKPTPKRVTIKSSPEPLEKRMPLTKSQFISKTPPPRKLTLKPEDIKITLKTKIDKIQKFEPKKVIQKIQQSDIIQKPKEIIHKIQEVVKPTTMTDEFEQQKELNSTIELQKLIKNKGNDLNIELCELFVNEMTEALGILTIEDLKLAADLFNKKEGALW